MFLTRSRAAANCLYRNITEMAGKTDSKTEYGKLSLFCTGLFVVLFFVFVISRPQSSSKAAFIFELCFYSFCLLGFLFAIVLAGMAAIRESRLWWLAILPPGGCSYIMVMMLLLTYAFGRLPPGWH
jgi:uncharacterized membrane protein